MNNFKYSKKTAFTLIEALMALTLMGLILMMMAPVISARSSRTAEVKCTSGGLIPYFSGTDEITIEDGVTKIYITAARPGSKASGGSSSHTGGNAGTAYKTMYYTLGDGNVPLNMQYKSIKIVFSGAVPRVSAIKIDGGEENLITNFTVANSTLTKVERGEVLQHGIPNSGTFLGPMFGAAGRGKTPSDSGASAHLDLSPPINSGIVVVEWPSNCIMIR